jgi:transcriptional antiterminator RfaH
MTDHDHGTSWFLAQYKPNSHHVAKCNLTRQGFAVFLPLHEETKRARGRFVTQMRPLFPGYLFVAFDIGKGPWRAINSTLGITRLVSLGGEPTPVAYELINQVKQRCDPDGKSLPLQTFKPGDQVTLAKGPFANFVATIEHLTPDRRVWVLLELMGHQMRVAVQAGQIRQTKA